MGDNMVSVSIQNHENASIQSCPRSKPLFRTLCTKTKPTKPFQLNQANQNIISTDPLKSHLIYPL